MQRSKKILTYHQSGLLGVSGVSSDLRRILAELPNNADVRLAVEVYVHRIRQTVGAMAATLKGVDALVFTAGVGEHSPEIRARVCEKLTYLGTGTRPQCNRKPQARRRRRLAGIGGTYPCYRHARVYHHHARNTPGGWRDKSQFRRPQQ
jgi:acetate kinase